MLPLAPARGRPRPAVPMPQGADRQRGCRSAKHGSACGSSSTMSAKSRRQKEKGACPQAASASVGARSSPREPAAGAPVDKEKADGNDHGSGNFLGPQGFAEEKIS